MAFVTKDMLEKVCEEIECQIDVCHVAWGTHMSACSAHRKRSEIHCQSVYDPSVIWGELKYEPDFFYKKFTKHLDSFIMLFSNKFVFACLAFIAQSLTSLSALNLFSCMVSSNGPNRWKSLGTKSGLYVGYGSVSQWISSSFPALRMAMCGRTLLWRR